MFHPCACCTVSRSCCFRIREGRARRSATDEGPSISNTRGRTLVRLRPGERGGRTHVEAMQNSSGMLFWRPPSRMRLHGWPGPAGCSSVAPMGAFSIARCVVPKLSWLSRAFLAAGGPSINMQPRAAATRENDVSGSRPISPSLADAPHTQQSGTSLGREGVSHDARSTRAGVAGGTRGVRVRVGARTRPFGSGEGTPPPRVPQSAIEPRRDLPASRVRSRNDARV
jgi:hypothetical protein